MIKENKFGVKYFSWKILWKFIIHPLKTTSAFIETSKELEEKSK